ITISSLFDYVVITFMIFFFFNYYCHIRDILSFPTRRSSDLLKEPNTRKVLSSDRGFFVNGMVVDIDIYCNKSREELANTVYNEQDRKSTRLNSSHVSISYAVFCLKKKKLKNNI